MPNRILKESICTSDSIEKLSWFEEAFFYRLIVNCDDYGRFDARLPIIKARLFPLNKTISERQIKDALNKLSETGMILLYEHDNKPYLQLISWERHQSIRTKRSKYPPYEVKNAKELISRYANSGTQSDIAFHDDIIPIPLPQVNEVKAVISLQLNDKTLYPICQEQIDNWKTLYPNVDIMQELRNMVGWLEGNPKRRKTQSGILRFVTTWLAKAQNSGNYRYTTKNHVADSASYEHDSSFTRGD